MIVLRYLAAIAVVLVTLAVALPFALVQVTAQALGAALELACLALGLVTVTAFELAADVLPGPFRLVARGAWTCGNRYIAPTCIRALTTAGRWLA